MTSDVFRFKQFEVRNTGSALKVGTDAVLLGALMTIKDTDRRLLDIGTGTGVIALMAAQRLPGAERIDAVEIDEISAREAAENFKSAPWHPVIHNCPLQKFEPQSDYDLIFSNPPYFDESLLNPTDRESRARHTVSLTLAEIFDFGRRHLSAQGRIALILPADAERRLLRTASSFGFGSTRVTRVCAKSGKAPKRIVAEFARERCETQFGTLTLQDDGSGARSAEYAELTKDFYL